MTAPDGVSLKKILETRGVGGLERHIFLCTHSDCSGSEESSQASWSRLKSCLAEADVDRKVFRSQAKCLRVCTGGPVAVVYPEGVWYRDLKPEAVERVVREHLLGGRVVEELAFARDDLSGKKSRPPPRPGAV